MHDEGRDENTDRRHEDDETRLLGDDSEDLDEQTRDLAAETRAIEEETRILAGEEPTYVYRGDNADNATRVMTSAGGAATQTAAPPPPPPKPRVVMTPPPPGKRRWLWLLLVILALIIIGLIVAWFLTRRDTPAATPSPSAAKTAWAGAWAPDGGHGGLVIEEQDQAFEVSGYSESLETTGATAATASADGRTLQFRLPAAVSFGAAQELRQGKLTAGPNRAQLSLTVERDDGTSLTLPLHRVTSLSGKPEVTTPPSTSPSPSPSASASQEAQRQQAIAGIERIGGGIEKFAEQTENNMFVYPVPADVRATGKVAEYVTPWPTNPYRPQEPMKPGSTPGDYAYEQLQGGTKYSLVVYLDNGTFVVK